MIENIFSTALLFVGVFAIFRMDGPKFDSDWVNALVLGVAVGAFAGMVISTLLWIWS